MPCYCHGTEALVSSGKEVADPPLEMACGAELLPVLVVMIQELRDAQARDRLTHCLFNLVKKPTAEQRSLIMDGCAELASRIGPARTAEELLPQCWEQVQSLSSSSLIQRQYYRHFLMV